MRTIAVTESAREANFLSAALDHFRHRDPPLEVLPAGSISGALSLARSLLLDADNKVALVLDADSVEGEDREERRRFLASSLADVRPAGWDVFLVDAFGDQSPSAARSTKTLVAVEDFLWPSKSHQQRLRNQEARMIEAVATWLREQGWDVQVEGEKDVDALARRGGTVLRIEVKGAALSTASAAKNDLNRLGDAIYRVMTWLATREGLVGIVVADTVTFRRAVDTVTGPLKVLGVGVFLVASDGSVVEYIPLAGGQSA